MPKFKIGDKISNGKIQYTVLDIQTNSIGDLCYVFKHPTKNNNFIWSSEEVDKLFELVSTSFNWQSFRNQAVKDILCAMISNEGVADERNVDEFTKDNQVKDAVLYADKLIAKLKEKEV